MNIKTFTEKLIKITVEELNLNISRHALHNFVNEDTLTRIW
jgi:hypothetical protein